jgi:DNA-binding NarL/FixJ family response regulator
MATGKRNAGTMVADRYAPLNLILIEPDSLLRLGIGRYLRRNTNWQIVAETDDISQTRSLITAQVEQAGLPDLLILGGTLAGTTTASNLSGLGLCRQLKGEYPYLRLLLLSAADDPGLADAWWMGIEGCCWRETGETELVEAIAQVATGQTYWSDRMKAVALGQMPPSSGLVSRRPVGRQIDLALRELEQALLSSQLSLIERWVLQGRRRELKASRWLVQQMFGGTAGAIGGAAARPELGASSDSPILGGTGNRGSGNADYLGADPNLPSPAGRLLQLSDLFDRFADKLRLPLENKSEIPLEIDILRLDKKRELFYLILRQFETIVDDLRFSEVLPEQLPEKRSRILEDLWKAVLSDFFGKYYTLEQRGQTIELVPALLQRYDRVEVDILSKIPFVNELLSYLLYQSALTIDNVTVPANSPQAIVQAGMILENLAIQIANAVVQPLLNTVADVEVIKQGFYDRRRLSTREIERFRNDLSWRYRVDRYLGEPTAIFESQYRLLVLAPEGIEQQSIYAPRRQELDTLAGVPLVVTLLLEARDAVSPRLKKATSLVGSGLVYVLTEVIGRGLGLVGRGIIKGIGNAIHDRR